MNDDLIDRFAARWEADADMMRSPPETHLNYPITGGAGRDPAAYEGQVEALWLLMNGRWGNYVYQMMYIFHAAELLGVQEVYLIKTDIFAFQDKTINSIQVRGQDHPPDPRLYCMQGVFFNPAPLGRLMDGLTPARRSYLITTYIKPLLIPLTSPRDVIGPKDLAIHIRSGDIFEGQEGEGGANAGGPAYIQPPLNFYLMVANRVFADSEGHVIVVAENALNPVILPLVKALDDRGHSVTLRLGHSLFDDLSWLFAARQVVFANGSIGIGIALLSDSIRSGYFFRRNGTGTLQDVSSYLGRKIDTYFVIDPQADYIQIGEWRNTPQQRNEMISFPMTALAWEDAGVDTEAAEEGPALMSSMSLINVALHRPAVQSSISEWSKPDDARRAVSGARTGSFAFCTGVDQEPFWCVDLESTFAIRRICIYNREDAASERCCPLIVEASSDGAAWSEICSVHYVFGGVRTQSPLDIRLKDPLQARFIRLRRTGAPGHFHLDQVEVYTGADDIETCAQMGQDIWVLEMTGGRSGGTFAEIGSTNGVNINNTYLLETRFGWRGVCVEPNPGFYESLKVNRKAKTFQRAVFRESGQRLRFLPNGELGTLAGFEDSDLHSPTRRDFLTTNDFIEVETIAPNDLFDQGGLPSAIDFLSLDTEGSEWDILQCIDFSKRQFALMAIEHNYVDDKRKLIYNKLKELGYYRFSVGFDDWYYHPVVLEALNGPVRVDVKAVLNQRRAKYGHGEEPA